MTIEWKKKSKGNAKIYICDEGSRAIVENHHGVFYDGIHFKSVDDAKKHVELHHRVCEAWGGEDG